MKTVSVLGSEWEILFRSEADDPKLRDCDGYCDESVKQIIVDSYDTDAVQNCADLDRIRRQVIRHELVHAFLFESGLGACSEWAQNEEMVDWIARQFSKLLEAFQAAEAMN